MKLSDNKKTFEVVVAYEAYDTYEVEADSEEEARKIVLSGEGDVTNRDEINFQVIETKEA